MVREPSHMKVHIIRMNSASDIGQPHIEFTGAVVALTPSQVQFFARQGKGKRDDLS